MQYYLEPNDRHKSFYRKAYVKDDGRMAILFSYDTPVAAIKDGKFYRLWGGWSATTSRHVIAFCENYSLPSFGKAVWDEIECVNMEDIA